MEQEALTVPSENVGVMLPPAAEAGIVLLWLLLPPLLREGHFNMSLGSLPLGPDLGVHRKDKVSGLIPLIS